MARASAAGVPIEQLLLADRMRLRQSAYPGPECLEPYEVEAHAREQLAPARQQHADRCDGCRVLLRSARPSDADLQAFRLALDQAPAPASARGFWFDLVGGPAAAVALAGGAYLVLQYVAPATDPSIRTAALAQLTGLLRPAVVAALWVASLAALAALLWRHGREVFEFSSGALAGGVALGLVGAVLGWQTVARTADTMRAALTLSQTRVVQALAARWPRHAAGLPAASQGVAVNTVMVASTAFAPATRISVDPSEEGRLHVESTMEGLPGSLIAEMRHDGGQLYWQRDQKRETLGRILYGSIAATDEGGFVLVDASGAQHPLKVSGDAAAYVPGTPLMVLVNTAGDAVSVQPALRAPSPER